MWRCSWGLSVVLTGLLTACCAGQAFAQDIESSGEFGPDESRSGTLPSDFNSLGSFGGEGSFAKPARSPGGIIVRMDSTEFSTCRYTLNQWSYNMQPGHQQQFAADREWTITYSPGVGRAAASYRLVAGTYQFRWTENGWQLYREPN